MRRVRRTGCPQCARALPCPSADYRTASVTPVWLDAAPIRSTTGTFPVDASPLGTRALICRSPANPGAAPAERMSAGYPPTVSVTGSVGFGSGSAAGWPSTAAGFSTPSPVAYRVTIDPRAAGSFGEFSMPFSFRAIAGPVPALTVKIAGADAATGTVTFPRDCPWKKTSTSTVLLPAIS